MELPIIHDPRDEEACYQALLKLIHSQGLHCPNCGSSEGWRVHRSYRAPVLDYLCTRCSCIFNAWSATPLCKTHLPPSVLWRVVNAVVQKESLTGLTRDLGRPRSTLTMWYRRLQGILRQSPPQTHRAQAPVQPGNPNTRS